MRSPATDPITDHPFDQMGLHVSGRTVPNGDLSVNETHSGVRVSNTRGTAAVAHWDVPDCGNAEYQS